MNWKQKEFEQIMNLQGIRKRTCMSRKLTSDIQTQVLTTAWDNYACERGKRTVVVYNT